MYHELIEKGQSSLIIIFSSINCDAGSFRFYRSFKNNSSDLLFLNCKNNDWYLNGIPSLADNFELSLHAIRKIIKKNKYKKIATFGSSMGAFGALIYGVNLKADQIFAGCPEVILGSEGGFYSRFNTGVLDFRSLFQGFSGEVNIFVGEDSYFDIAQSSYLISDNTNIYILNGESHGVFEAIEFDIGCGRLVSCYLSGVDFETLGFRKDYDYMAYSRVFHEIQIKISKKDIDTKDIMCLKKIANSCSNIRVQSHAYFLISVIFMNNFEFSKAKEYSLMSCSLNRKSPKILSHHFRVCEYDNDFLGIIFFREDLRNMLVSKNQKYLQNMRGVKIKEAISFFNKATERLEINHFLKI